MTTDTLKHYYILIKPWDVYVKEAAYFKAQGGLEQEWGKGWILIHAQSISDARITGERRRDRKIIIKNQGSTTIKDRGDQFSSTLIDDLQELIQEKSLIVNVNGRQKIIAIIDINEKGQLELFTDVHEKGQLELFN